MKIDATFLKTFGSGSDPNDIICLEGHAYTMDLINSGRCEAKVIPIRDTIKQDIENGSIDETKGRIWYMWALDITKNSDAIEYWGNAIYNDDFLVYDRTTERKYFKDLEEAKSYRQELMQKTLNNIFDRINVLKVYKKIDGFTTIAVKHIEEITDGFIYKVLDEVTGQFVDCDTKEDALRVFEIFEQRLIADLKNEVRIKQKITDPDEGFEAWKELSI